MNRQGRDMSTPRKEFGHGAVTAGGRRNTSGYRTARNIQYV